MCVRNAEPCARHVPSRASEFRGRWGTCRPQIVETTGVSTYELGRDRQGPTRFCPKRTRLSVVAQRLNMKSEPNSKPIKANPKPILGAKANLVDNTFQVLYRLIDVFTVLY